jgi:methionyl-tRNA formyltransferase
LNNILKIVILISAERGRRCLESLYDCLSSEDEVTVFSFRESPWEPSFLKNIERLAKKYNSKFYVTSKVHDEEFNKVWLSQVDVIIAIGWRYLIPPQVYESAKSGCYIFHDSYLPEYRGFGPTVWSIRNGKKYTGISVFKISEKVDEGPILFQEKVLIGSEEYISEVMEKITVKCEILIKKLYQSVKSNSFSLINQKHEDASYLCKLIPNDFRIDWKKNSREIFNLIRSYSPPYSGAFTFYENKKLFVYSASVVNIPKYSGYIEGRVMSFNNDSSVTIFCGNGSALKVISVSVDGIKIQNPTNIIKSIGGTLES